MAGLTPPRVPDQPVPVFTAGDPPRLERACAGRAFAERRDAALIAVFGRPVSASRSCRNPRQRPQITVRQCRPALARCLMSYSPEDRHPGGDPVCSGSDRPKISASFQIVVD
jgi:hypothetical protein